MTLREIVYHNATEWAVIDHLYICFTPSKACRSSFMPTWHVIPGTKRVTADGHAPPARNGF